MQTLKPKYEGKDKNFEEKVTELLKQFTDKSLVPDSIMSYYENTKLNSRHCMSISPVCNSAV